MFEFIRQWDLRILQFFNSSLASPINDPIMKLISAEWPTVLIAALLFTHAIYKKNWSRFKILLWIAVTVSITDIISAQFIKPYVERLRPCKIPDLVRIVQGCAGTFGFPSNHAANGAAFATLWILCFRQLKVGFIMAGLVLAIGLSRIYLGVHYPSDVLMGFVLGITLAALSYQIIKRMNFFRSGQPLIPSIADE